MRQHLQDKLFNDFPNLYVYEDSNGVTSRMEYGFCCKDGWYDILYRLSTRLTAIIDSNPALRGTVAVQVKEKFGSLRFYISRHDEQMASAIAEAEEETARTCAQCGRPGALRYTDWMQTLCEPCREWIEWRKRQMRRQLHRKDSAIG